MNPFAPQERKRARQIATAVFLALLCPISATAQETREVTVGEARQIARQALAAGDIRTASAISSALLRKNPEDFEAWLQQAFVRRAMGDLDGAADAATRAWRLAKTPAMRFDAAFLAADIAARQERLTSSKIWLRRADQNAPNDRTRETVASAFRQVAARSPLDVRFSFSIRPTDNLNNGSDPDASVESVFGTATTDPAISGIEAIGSVNLTYRLSESATQRTEAYVGAYVRLAFPEDGFEDILFDPTNPFDERPTSRDYDYVMATVGISHRRVVFDGLGPTGLRFGIGGTYYGNAPYAQFGELALTQDIRQDSGLLRLGFTLRNEDVLGSQKNASYVARTLAADWYDRTENGIAWSVGVAATDYDSRASTVEGTRIEVHSRVALDQTIWGAEPDLSLSVARRDMPEFNDLTGSLEPGRRDVTTRATLGLTYPNFSWYGFEPRVEISGSITDSDRDLWDRRTLSVGATLVSRF